MELLELHILQSFPVSCLNRDDVGAPKSAVFGGVPRARVSSQCWKRAIRQMAKELQPDLFKGIRSRYLVEPLKTEFQKQGQTEANAGLLALSAAGAISKLDSLEKGNIKTLMFFTPKEIENIVKAFLEQDPSSTLNEFIKNAEKEKDKEAEKLMKKAESELAAMAKNAAKALASPVKDAADIALFGRMVADDHSLMIDGAGMFSHALSTHKSGNEIDFFSAVDEKMPMGAEGAGHIGTLEFNSACYYRYAGLNIDLLKQNLALFSENEIKLVLEAFVKSVILSVPSARKNTMFAQSPPGYVLELRRKGQPICLSNSFETPVRSTVKGFLNPSAEALKSHYQNLKKLYNIKSDVEISIPLVDLNSFVNNLVEWNRDEITETEMNPEEKP